MGNTTRYGTTHAGHEIELDFDRSKIVLDQARLVVDGDVVDKASVFYGDKHLTTTLPDGTEIHVTVDSGMDGSCAGRSEGFGWVVDGPDGAGPAARWSSARRWLGFGGVLTAHRGRMRRVATPSPWVRGWVRKPLA